MQLPVGIETNFLSLHRLHADSEHQQQNSLH
jgi:hypothetical protein